MTPTRGPWAQTPTGNAGGAQPHRRWVAGQDQRSGAPVPVDDQDREAGEREALALGAEEPIQHAEDGDLIEAGEGQRAPGAAEAGRQRRGVGPVAHHVAHEHCARAVVVLDRVVEVAAQLGPPAARLVPHEHADVGGPDGRRGGEGTLESSVLGPLPLGPNELAAELCRPVPLDRVAHRPGQQLLVDPALDQVVLGAGAQCRGAELLGGRSRQHDDGGIRCAFGEALHAHRAVGVGQADVEQDAVRRHRLPTGVRERGDPIDRRPRQAPAQQLAHHAVVVLVVVHEQEAPRRLGYGDLEDLARRPEGHQ